MSDLVFKLTEGQMNKTDFIWELKYQKGKQVTKILKRLPDEYKKDKRILEIILGTSSILFAKLDKESKRDFELIALCAPRFSKLIDHLDEDLQQNKDVVLECIKNKSFKFNKIPKALVEDHDIALAFLKTHGYHSLQNFIKLSHDLNFIEKLINKRPSVYSHLPSNIQKLPECIKMLAKVEFARIAYVDPLLIKDDKQLIYDLYDISSEGLKLTQFYKLWEQFKREDGLLEKLIDKSSLNIPRKKI